MKERQDGSIAREVRKTIVVGENSYFSEQLSRNYSVIN